MPYKIVAVYIIIISLISAAVTVYDKIAAKKAPRERTPEAKLLLLSALGGSAAMYIVMQLIRHKTKHMKFMVGIPLIIVAQAIVLVALHIFVFKAI